MSEELIATAEPWTADKWCAEYEKSEKSRNEMFAELKMLKSELAMAQEILREIRDGEVNPEDEADKYLRDHIPSELSAARKERDELKAKLEEANNGNWYGAGIKIATALALAERKPEDIADAVETLIIDYAKEKEKVAAFTPPLVPLPEDILCRIQVPVPLGIMAALTRAIADEAKNRLGKKALMRQIGNHIEFFTEKP